METIFIKDSVRVTDPCYNKDIWCAKTVYNLMKGNYKPMLEYNLDERVSALMIIHEDYEEVWEELPANLISTDIGVDSGTCGIFDLDYYMEQADTTSEYTEGTWYYRACTCADTEEQADIIDGKGVVCSSGYGDGCYDLYTITNANDDIVGLELRFIGLTTSY